MDREKVIEWLEGLAEPDWMDFYSESEVQNTAIAALDLLDELLKERENASKRNPVIVCPHCGKRLK